MVTNLRGRIGKIATPQLYSALAVRDGLKDRNADSRTDSADDPSTSRINLVSFHPVG